MNGEILVSDNMQIRYEISKGLKDRENKLVTKVLLFYNYSFKI